MQQAGHNYEHESLYAHHTQPHPQTRNTLRNTLYNTRTAYCTLSINLTRVCDEIVLPGRRLAAAGLSPLERLWINEWTAAPHRDFAYR